MRWAQRGGGGGVDPGAHGGGFGLHGPLRRERCAGGGDWGRGEVWGRLMWRLWRGQPLRTALPPSISLQSKFCKTRTWRLLSWKALRELNDLFIPFLRTKIKCVRRKIGQEKNCIRPTGLIYLLQTLLKNIAGRLPENSRNRFVDRQSKKTVKDRPKNSSFHWRLICYILIKNLYKLLLPLLADLE